MASESGWMEKPEEIRESSCDAAITTHGNAIVRLFTRMHVDGSITSHMDHLAFRVFLSQLRPALLAWKEMRRKS